MPFDTPLQPSIAEANVFKAWNWGIARVSHSTQSCWDLVIPVNKGDFDTRVDLYKFTILAFQVRNRQTDVSSDWLTLLHTDLVKHPTGTSKTAHYNTWFALHVSHKKVGVEVMTSHQDRRI